MVFYWMAGMKNFFLNLTRIVEKNPRVYFAIIFGMAACMMLFVAEAVHVQTISDALQTRDQSVLKASIEPVSSCYTWSRVLAIAVMVLWSTAEYRKTKKQLGLK